MANPFRDALLRKRIDPEPVLKSVGLSTNTLAKENGFISAQSWYDFAAASADRLDDPCLGYNIGATAGLNTLPNMRVLELPYATLGELLTALVIDVGRFSTLATYLLSTDGTRANLTTQRTFIPASPPAQIDGYFTGFMIRIMRLCTGSKWHPEDLKVQVCNPEAIPVGELPAGSILAKDPRMFLLPCSLDVAAH
ncbi:AraC family transcriptional regulator ligand-binding domain-containing protein [Shimia sagamensis]|nr:AraC family transcriptional regulator ligand-binding domain-containing protein [Shimia sagamensis]